MPSFAPLVAVVKGGSVYPSPPVCWGEEDDSGGKRVDDGGLKNRQAKEPVGSNGSRTALDLASPSVSTEWSISIMVDEMADAVRSQDMNGESAERD
ncbi:hypothetical protein LTR91_025857 [Friedmanniomyces endolithicus]|uniref:Uncharacterized protein n=1 Tax=Friedmanniomyces endolithicus TaxID=329885 RepID=A0AAN6GZ59_9PEZI|nr:hypothetical protein LTR57_024402 [Friedmanniomyces endolithicus]KAK0950185.1 hypothetical protein LTR91_025857 [Friedmanniomyces endolithicus]